MKIHARLAVFAAAIMALAASSLESRAAVGARAYKTNFSSASSQAVHSGVRRVARKHRAVRRRHGLPHSRVAGRNACRAAAARFGVPISTALAVCRLESGFRCSAVGGAGELGLLQIKLATARGLGYRGSRRGLLGCATGAYWGMKHLSLAIRRGGVWKHNQGLGARRPTRAARVYARKVAALRRRYR